MVKWEYDWEYDRHDPRDTVEMLDRKGQRGWELVCIEQGIAYFKRPITEH